MGKKVEPIRSEKDINSIKKLLQGNKRDLLLFILGINSGIRVGDLVQLKVEDLKDKETGDNVTLLEGKTGKQNYITVNKAIHKAWIDYMKEYKPGDDAYIFFSRKRGYHLNTDSCKRMIKGWCSDINLHGNYGAHTLRKTFGYQQRVKFGTSIEVLMHRYNHSSPTITRRYIGITDKEVHNVMMNEIWFAITGLYYSII